MISKPVISDRSQSQNRFLSDLKTGLFSDLKTDFCRWSSIFPKVIIIIIIIIINYIIIIIINYIIIIIIIIIVL